MSEERGYKESGDVGKLDLTLFPAWAKAVITQVFSYGEQKYSRDNWLKGLPLTQLLEAAERHMIKHRAGEMFDPESGCLHLAHAACLHVMMLELFLQKRLDEDGAQLNPDIISHLKKNHNTAKNVLLAVAGGSDTITSKAWREMEGGRTILREVSRDRRERRDRRKEDRVELPPKPRD